VLGIVAEPKSTSSPIQWKENMDLSKKQKETIMEGRGRQGGRDVKTFFSWFSDNTDPAADDIAEIIKDDLWPKPPRQCYLIPDEDEEDEDDQ
jgi:template-activating factor I